MVWVAAAVMRPGEARRELEAWQPVVAFGTAIKDPSSIVPCMATMPWAAWEELVVTVVVVFIESAVGMEPTVAEPTGEPYTTSIVKSKC